MKIVFTSGSKKVTFAYIKYPQGIDINNETGAIPV